MSDIPTPRQKFEEWAESKFNLLQGVHEYVSDRTEIAWEVWQAASKELAAVTDQRDKAWETTKEQHAIIEGLMKTQLDNIILTSQRDRLAEAAKKGLESIERGKLDGCIESQSRMDLCFNDLREALQSLTQP